MFDPQMYRSREEIEAWRARGPIHRFQTWLETNGFIHAADADAIERGVAAEIAAAVAFAEAGTPEPVEDLERFVTMTEIPS
jgi:TPP-dependent pyruvate/acetoin dehydrogenase alpha subunit